MRTVSKPSLEEAVISRVYSFDDCWVWGGCLTHNGYGQLTYKQRRYRAHRAAYLVWVGPIPKGALIMHKCDNRACVNPSHLKVGTAKDNTRDMIKKNRHDWSGLKGMR